MFTNPVGTAWQGKFIAKTDGFLTLGGGRQISYGLYKGSPDLIGWKKIKITPEMVGATIAVFVGIECKTDIGKPSDEQKHFLDRLTADGALAGVARSAEDAIRIVTRLDLLK